MRHARARAFPGTNLRYLQVVPPLDKVATMAKYKIAWMPGDGVGNDVMEAARIVLNRLTLDAEYVPCDIGWDFWCKEGNALPDRTVKVWEVTLVSP